MLISISLLGQAVARLPDGRLNANHPLFPVILRVTEFQANNVDPVTDVSRKEILPYDTVQYFDQLIDHDDPSKGTFKVRYLTTWEYYNPGGPIILIMPCEVNGDGFWGHLANQTIKGQIAKQEGGATIVVEHRFNGLSNPYSDLSVKSFEVHTLDQAIEYFLLLHNKRGGQVGPDKAPWIFVGGSYPGALAYWLKVAKPDTFYAAYSSSGVVQAIEDLWSYFEPICHHVPINCDMRTSGRIDPTVAAVQDKALALLKTWLAARPEYKRELKVGGASKARGC